MHTHVINIRKTKINLIKIVYYLNKNISHTYTLLSNLNITSPFNPILIPFYS